MKTKRTRLRPGIKGLTALVLAGTLCLGLAACGGRGRGAAVPAAPAPSARPAETATPAPSPTPNPRQRTEAALTLAIPPVTGAWGPFDAAAGGDRAVQRLTQTPLLARAANGSFPETAEGAGAAGVRRIQWGDGSTVLRLRMREDLRFPDGSYADVSDLLFTLYVLLDPGYQGQLRLRDCKLLGLEEYRCRCTTEQLEAWSALYDEPGEDYAQLREDCLRLAWERELRALTEMCREEYLETYALSALGIGAEEARASEGALRVFAMWCAGLAESAGYYGYLRDALGRSWNPAWGILPEEEAMVELFSRSYPDPADFDRATGLGVASLAREEFIRRCAAGEPASTAGPGTVAGIRQVDDYTVELQFTSFSPADLERLGSLFLASLNILGDRSLFRPEEGSFGFPYGEAGTLAETAQAFPGAGAYFLREEGEAGLRLSSNELYYLGAPAVGELRLLTAPEAELFSLVAEGGADLACLPGSAELWEAAAELPGIIPRSVATDEYGWLQLDPSAFAAAGEARGLALREAVLRVSAACCRTAAAEQYGAAAALLGREESPEEALAAVGELLAALPEAAAPAPEITALAVGSGSGARACREGLLEASRLLKEAGILLTVKDTGDDVPLRAAPEAGEAALLAGFSHQPEPLAEDGTLPGNRRAFCRRLDLLAVNTGRVDQLTLPVELSWVRDHISVIETLALK